MITVKKVNNFDGMGLEASLELIKKNISRNLNYVIEIVESERIIKLNIPFSELYRKCSETEWIELMQLIKTVTASN